MENGKPIIEAEWTRSCSFSLIQNYNQTTFFKKVFQYKKCSLWGEESSPVRAAGWKQLLWFMLRFRRRGKGVSGQQQKDEAVCSYSLVHPNPVIIYCRDGQTPAQDAQRGPGVSILPGFKTQLDTAVRTPSNQATLEPIKEMNEETSGGSLLT